MSASLLSGTKLSKEILSQEIRPHVFELNKKNIQPKTVIILIGDNPASDIYVRQKEKWAHKAHIKLDVLRFPADTSLSKLLDTIQNANQDSSIHGIIVQLPIPQNIPVSLLLNQISPKKDIDGFTTQNLGKLFVGEEPYFTPCTPQGILKMLQHHNITISGKKVVLVGRSLIVGRPLSALFLSQNATVTICHSHTDNLSKETLSADILVAALGKPQYIKGSWIKKGATVIDVGIHKNLDGTLCGDVDFQSAQEKASFITPVPGGVGPMTVISLLQNTVKAAYKQNE